MMKKVLFLLLLTPLLFAADFYDTDGTTLFTPAQVAALVDPSWKLDNGKTVLRTAAEETASTQTLADKRISKKTDILQRTAELMGGGFTYDSVVFASNRTNREKFEATYHAAKDGLLTYPVTIPLLNDDTYSVVDQAAFDTMRDAARTWGLAIVNTEATLLKSVKDAVDAAAVDAVTDTR